MSGAMPPGKQRRPLPIWHADGPLSAEHMARLRNAKIGLWLDYEVKPYAADRGDMERRVLAWGSRPPFLCSYALVDPMGSDREVDRALAWVLGEGECDAVTTLPDLLAVWLGGAVREVPPDELEAEARLAAYEAGLD